MSTCRRCNSKVYPSSTEGYKYQCFDCDEDLLSFEVNETEEVYMKLTPKQIVEVLHDRGIVNNTNDPEMLTPILREYLQRNGSEVYHVSRGLIDLGGGDSVMMKNYYIVTEEDTLEDVIQNLNGGYAFAFVYNEDWSIEEYGSVGAFIDEEGYIHRPW